MKKYLLSMVLCTLSVLANATSFPKVILRGDYPDPSIVRDGDDFYMTHSPFYYHPGFLIWHSKDLVNWEPICRALPDYEGSAMAPDLVKYEGKFYLYYPSAGTNWVSVADNIRGPWSEPVDLKVSGIDPGHISDDKGNRYLYVNEGEVIRLAPDGLSTIGEKQKVYDGWVYPSHWKTEGMYLESPKLIYHDGYYYLTSAQGGTAGPATSHMCVMARSKNVLGPWENSPYNPLVHTYSDTEQWWSKGHGTLIDDADGNWWMVYHAYANGYHTLGRQTLIEPMEFKSDGWFAPMSESSALLPGESKRINHDDDFDDDELDLQWTFWKENALDKITVKNSALKVPAKGSTPVDGRILLMTPEDSCYETEVSVECGKNNKAGMLLFYNEKAFAGVVADGDNFIIYRNKENTDIHRNHIGSKFNVRLLNNGNKVTMQIAGENRQWVTLAENIDVSDMNHNELGGFFALRVGLISTGNDSAIFKKFRYKNTTPKEPDMSAYLMVYHQDNTHGLHMALSRDGYTFTALNEGNPVIVGDTIAEQKGIRDPHIFRGPNGGFYLVMTDLHIFAKQEGLRETEWERNGNEYGWGNNRGLILMKSKDLINWKHTLLRIDSLSESLENVGCAWAPETGYDEKTGKLMLYYTMRQKTEQNKLYYMYINDDFDSVETMPVQLFEYPDTSKSAIDGDIVKVGGLYHLFYVAHDGTPGIKQAVSTDITGNYQYDSRWCDFEDAACEAPSVWKRIGEDRWVLMYDVYGISPHNFGFAETSDFEHFINLGRFNEGVMKAVGFTSSPKHGAIIHLTKEEADNIEAYWNK